MKIPYGKHTIDDTDIAAVIETLKSDFLTQGPKIKKFEEKFAKYVGSKYAVAVSNGTAALHLACLTLGLREGDEFITTPLTFAASSNCGLYCGAKPIFADIDERGLLNELEIENKISLKTKLIIPVHYSGFVCNMEKIKEIAEKHSLKIIEDSCHALGAEYKNSKIGDCAYSDISIFSFHPVKHIATGEGGMLTTNSKEIYDKLILLRSHGIEKKDKWGQDMTCLGYNYRITDIQCALGISQLNKLNAFLKQRRNIANYYDCAFKNNSSIEIISPLKDEHASYHLYVIKVKNSETREKLYDFLKENNIFCQVHYPLVYFHSYYKNLGYKEGICPNAEKLYNQILSIPIFPSLTKEEQDYVIAKIDEFFKIN